MRPTPGEYLADIRRLLDVVAEDPGLSAPSTVALSDARRAVRRLESSWDDLVPFLIEDSRRVGELLSGLGATVSAVPPRDARFSAVEAHNNELRAQLSAFIASGPLTPADRTAIAQYLRDRLANDPSHRSSR